MSNVVVIAKYQQKLDDAIQTLRPLLAQDAQLPAYVAGNIEQLSRLLQNQSIELEAFNAIRQKLAKQLRQYHRVTALSRSLFHVLTLMAKIKPLNDKDIFDLVTPSLADDGQARKRWFYASTGHAYPLENLVKCRIKTEGKMVFFNPLMGAQVPFSHTDNQAIVTLANKHGIVIPDPQQDAQRFLAGVLRRYLIRSLMVQGELQAQLPGLWSAVKKHLGERSKLNGIKPFMAYLVSPRFGYAWLSFNALPVLLYLFAPSASNINSLVNLSLALTATSMVTAIQTDIVKQFFVQVDAAFLGVCKASVFLMGVVTNLRVSVAPNLSNVALARVNGFFPSICTNIAGWIVDAEKAVSPETRGQRSLAMLNSLAQMTMPIVHSVWQAKLSFELASFKARFPNVAHRANSLLNTCAYLLRDIGQYFQQGRTDAIGEVITEVLSDSLRVMAAQAQAGQAFSPADTPWAQLLGRAMQQAVSGSQEAQPAPTADVPGNS